MPQNAFKKPLDNYSKCYKYANKMVEKICDNIKIKQSGIYYTNKLVDRIQVKLYPMLKKLVQRDIPKKIGLDESIPLDEVIFNLDKLITVNESCNGCGICAKVCPVNNIQLSIDKPVWKHSCENCLACYNFCPNQAINFGIVSDGHRYVHPEYTANQAIDMKK